MTVSEKIFEIMARKGISQKQLSDRTGITPSTISDWRHKKTNPASDKIILISDALGVSPLEILVTSEKEKYTPLSYAMVDKTSEEYQVISAYQKLGPRAKDRVMGYLDALVELKR